MAKKYSKGLKREGIEPIERCNRIAEEFQSMLKQLDISNDDYVRTTEDRHKKVVAQLLQDLYDRGDIYQAEYQRILFYSGRAISSGKRQGGWRMAGNLWRSY